MQWSRKEAADSLINEAIEMKKKMQIDGPEVVKIKAMPDCVMTHRGIKYAVVKAIFPPNLTRSLTSKTKGGAMAKKPEEVISRDETTVAAWALVPLRYVVSPENDLGEIAP